MGDGIGIITLVEKGLIIKEKIIGESGRIIGIKFENIQVWNVYPISGAGNKQKTKYIQKRKNVNISDFASK